MKCMQQKCRNQHKMPKGNNNLLQMHLGSWFTLENFEQFLKTKLVLYNATFGVSPNICRILII